MRAADVCARLGTSENGLTSQEASARLEQDGPNEIPDPPPPTLARTMARQVRDPIVSLLLAAGVIAIAIGHPVDAAVIFAAVALNTGVGTLQERKAEGILAAVRAMQPASARVVRDGVLQRVAARALVRGDLVLVFDGDRIPADLRIVSSHGARADLSILTGESEPVALSVAPLAGETRLPGDWTNMALQGTLLVTGEIRGVVVSTATATEFGRIGMHAAAPMRRKTPLERKFRRFGHALIGVVLAASLVVGAAGAARGLPARDVALLVVALVVAVVPEGLPVVVTITLAVGVARMGRRHAIIRRLPSVETLGSCTVIASDKTGTLTRNEMTVVALVVDGTRYDVTGVGYAPLGELRREGRPAASDPALVTLLRAGLLANDAHLLEEGDRFVPHGDPTEVALIVVAEKAGLSREAEGASHTREGHAAFQSERRYSASLRRDRSGRLVAYLKGAPETVIALCDRSARGEGDAHAPAMHEALAAEGLRVLAAATRPWPEGRAFTPVEIERGGFELAGFFGLLDPPRPEAVDAVALCRRGGIRVLMVTGDHKGTAEAIAARMGIGAGDSEAVTGDELARADADQLTRLAAARSVFARVSPEQKLRLVEALRARGDIVAVTGDGVNDAPALRRADIGIAMGVSGTDITREAADMVLLDDNFASIVAAVEEGRHVFDNVRKVTYFLLSTSAGTILAVAAGIALGLPLLALPAQILWINLVTNGLQDLALAFEPPEPRTADQPPRNPREGILDASRLLAVPLVGLVVMAGTLLVFTRTLGSTGNLDAARSAAVTTIVLFQFFHVYSARSYTRSIARIPLFSNPWLFLAVLLALGAHVGYLYAPPMQAIFLSAPLDAGTLAACAATAASVVAFEEARKAWARRSLARGSDDPRGPASS